MRDRRLHRQTFAEDAEYLQKTSRGIAAAELLSDYNLDTSRSFRALKVWMTLKEHGADKFGRLIDQGIAQARYLDGLFAAEPMIERMAPCVVDILCFRFNPGGLAEDAMRALNIEIMVQMQETGLAAVSDTTIQGRHSLRVAICNHRTTLSDLDLLRVEVLRIGSKLTQSAA